MVGLFVEVDNTLRASPHTTDLYRSTLEVLHMEFRAVLQGLAARALTIMFKLPDKRPVAVLSLQVVLQMDKSYDSPTHIRRGYRYVGPRLLPLPLVSSTF
jgi:hypothetical protein